MIRSGYAGDCEHNYRDGFIASSEVKLSMIELGLVQEQMPV